MVHFLFPASEYWFHHWIPASTSLGTCHIFKDHFLCSSLRCAMGGGHKQGLTAIQVYRIIPPKRGLFQVKAFQEMLGIYKDHNADVLCLFDALSFLQEHTRSVWWMSCIDSLLNVDDFWVINSSGSCVRREEQALDQRTCRTLGCRDLRLT